jgi:hypothetical protein
MLELWIVLSMSAIPSDVNVEIRIEMVYVKEVELR